MKKIKLVVNYIDLPLTPQRIFDYKRGHSIPDYLLIVPESQEVFRSFPIEKKTEKMGIVSIVVRE
jgi:hypothetical protein